VKIHAKHIIKIKFFIISLLLTSLSGCQSISSLVRDEQPYYTKDTQIKSVRKTIPDEKIDTAARSLAAEGLALMETGEYQKASEQFNKALKLDINNSYLHFLNGLTYHYRAIKEESQLYELAIEGYTRARKFDSSNWYASFYLGQVYMEQRNFELAKKNFETAAIYASNDPDVLYGLAAASYYSRDLRTAEAALKQLRKLTLNDDLSTAVYHSSAIVNAAIGQPQEAQNYLSKFKILAPENINNALVLNRVEDWNRVHRIAQKENLVKTAGVYDSYYGYENHDEEDEGESDSEDNNENESYGYYSQVINNDETEDEFVDDQMAVVDVTIIRTEEDISTAKGVNLLSGLQIQFGDPLSGIPGLSFGRERVKDLTGTDNDTINTRTITNLISFSGVTYSLNIANSQTGRNEILARPTLVARAGQMSDFFSGVEVAAAATSGGAGDSVSIEKEVGVKLSVTPEFLPNDRVILQVEAERTFLTQPSRSVEFEFRLDTSKTTVNANVAMKFGQTLILSGLSERETEKNRDGVPILQDVPGLQYLFSRATTRDFRKSVLILLTPRRAQYLYEAEDERDSRLENLPEEEKERSLFERRFNDWFEPLPHTAHIFEHFKTNLLYQDEFRTGDFPLIKWNSLQTHSDRIRGAQQFLYY
jgi:general secretion pathway protein D